MKVLKGGDSIILCEDRSAIDVGDEGATGFVAGGFVG